MSQRTILRSTFARQRACELIMKAPGGFIAEVREPRRTNAQNDKMHAMLTDIARAKPQGREHDKDVWKDIFLDALGVKADWVPSLDGQTVLNTRRRSSHLTKAQMSDMIELMYSYGAEHGVRWSDEQEQAA